MKPRSKPSSSQTGFSLIELLVVVAIIAIMAAVSLPAILRYIRNFQIRGATQQVAGQIQAARNKAISKNVNLGVVFVVLSATEYQWVIEDDQAQGTDRKSTRQPLPDLLKLKIQTGPGNVVTTDGPIVQSLPLGIQFSTACPTSSTPQQWQLPTGGAWDKGLRFNRLGSWCDPEGAATLPCADLDAGQDRVYNVASGAGVGSYLCLEQPRTTLKRTVTVTQGGRVLVQP